MSNEFIDYGEDTDDDFNRTTKLARAEHEAKWKDRTPTTMAEFKEKYYIVTHPRMDAVNLGMFQVYYHLPSEDKQAIKKTWENVKANCCACIDEMLADLEKL